MPTRPLVLALLVLLATSLHAAMPAPDFTESDFIGGLTYPTALAFLPDGRLLVTQLGGELLLVDGGTAKTLITIPVCADPADGLETGLLGLAVHPDFPTDRRIYLYRTVASPGTCNPPLNRVNELICVELAGDTVDPGTLLHLLSCIRSDTGDHNGGGLRVGPDRRLYIGVGDTGLGDDDLPPGMSTNPYAQDLGAVEGKILRVNLDFFGAGGGIPPDNPFVNQAGARGEIFAYGFRNPFRFGFDPMTGRLWAGDVGEITVEELDIVTKGGNYGWPRCEGNLPAGCAQPGDIAPVFTYEHSGSGLSGHAVIGGAFAGGGGFAGLAGEYVFADFGDPPDVAGAIYHAPLNATRDGLGTPAPIATDVEGPVDLTFGPDGALYYVAHLAGVVRRVVTTATSTGCTAPADCVSRLAAVLPNPVFAATPAARRAAVKLAALEKKAAGAITRAVGASGRKRTRQSTRARHLLASLLTTAQHADAKGRLGVPLATVHDAVAALLAVLPA